jgi:sugar phosphate isomerase/epimerase
MKFAVSTIGMPGQTLGMALMVAAEAGCAGVTLRLHPDAGVYLGMTKSQRTGVREAVAAEELEIVALAGYARVAAPGPDAPVIAQLTAGLTLAHDLGAGGLRVFPGGPDVGAAARRVRAAVDDSPGDAKVFVETYGDMPTGQAVARLLDVVALPERTAAVWDLLHPWRHGEVPGETLSALAGRLGYVQLKDVVSATDLTPVRPGAGAVPLRAAGELLRDAGYAGWASLEWERTWYPRVGSVMKVLPAARAWVKEFSRTVPPDSPPSP